jgi:hypothetical protein
MVDNGGETTQVGYEIDALKIPSPHLQRSVSMDFQEMVSTAQIRYCQKNGCRLEKPMMVVLYHSKLI